MMHKYKTARNTLSILILVTLLIIVILISFTLGRYPITPSNLLNLLLYPLNPDKSPLSEDIITIIINIRLPRILSSCIVGASLSSAGAAYQGVFRNPMSSPDILGASSGAGFGAALAILLGYSNNGIAMMAFVFSLTSVSLVWFISIKVTGNQVHTLILAGIMIGSLFSAGTSFIKLVADPSNQLPAITYWMMGSLSGISNNDILNAMIPISIGLSLLFLFRWRINLLALGDDQASTMGINVIHLRIIIILASTLVTSTSVAISGMIGWVGLVIPHLSRRLVGNNYRILMPTTAIFGSLFLLIVDNISRNLLPTEIPIGILTAFIGAPFFIWLIVRKEGI